MIRIIRIFARTLGIAAVAFLVVSAALLTAARVVLPHAHEYTHKVEQLLSEALNAPVRIGALDATWNRFDPQLVIKDVRILDALTQQELARFDRARLDFNLWALLVDAKMGLNGVAISGIQVVVERTADGRIHVIGLGNVSDREIRFDNALLESWLFGRLRWDIEGSELEFRDNLADARVLKFTEVNAHLRNDGARHELSGSIKLPAQIGDHVRFGVDISGDPLQPVSWSGVVYVNGKNLQLAALAREFDRSDAAPLSAGRADVQLWTHWGNGMQRIVGEVDAHDVALKTNVADAAEVAFSRLSTQLEVLRTAKGWKTDLRRLVAARGGRAWPETQAALKFETVADSNWPSVDARMTFVRLEDVAALAGSWPGLDESARAYLTQTQPRGDARGLTFKFYPGVQHARYRLHAEVIGLGLTANESMPGFSGVNGVVAANERGGTFDLDNRASVLHLPNLFRGPLPLGSVRGAVRWELDPQRHGWRVVSDLLTVSGVDGEVSATLTLEKPDADTAPYVDLVAAFQNGDGHQVSRYLPAAIMPTSVVDWLDRSIKDGQVTEGGIVLHGPMDQFPFTNGAGRFEVRAHVEQGTLDYLPDWPRIENIDTELIFSGHSMEVRAASARIFNSTLRDVIVAIPDVTSEYAILTISGNVAGDTADQLAFIQMAPPLKERVGRNLSDLTVRGQSDLHLELAIPLGHSLRMDTQVAAFATLKDNTLALGSWGPLLSKVDGALVIDNDGIRSDRVRAQVLDQPATLDVKTINTDDGALVQVRGRGALNASALMTRFTPEWAERVGGGGRWTANLRLPLKPGGANVKRVRVEALLDDVNVRLPQPLGKRSGETLLVEVNAELGDAEQKLFVQYGNRMGVGLALTSEDGTARVSRGEIRFGDGRVSIPRQTGLRVSGNLEKLSLDEWYSDPGAKALWNSANRPSRDKRTATPLLNDVDIHANRLVAFGQPLSAAHVKIVRGGKNWRASINSQEFAGQVRVPIELSQAPIVMDLERWKYIPVEGTNRTQLDPRDLPAMEIKTEKFSYGNVDFGRMELKATKFAFGWRVDSLALITPMTMVNGSGAWTYDGKSHQSHFNLDVISENIGHTMSTFGYADSIDGGSGRINVQVAWAAPLPDVSPDLLDGRVSMAFKKGRLLEVSPGAGRLFALLSIQALPRRLSLDFSDLFAKGFAFDDINGEFRLERGQAYTSTLAMNGPAAKIRAAGRIGLAEHDYDQLVRVIPDLTGSVPTLTTFAVSPQVGVVTFVLGKIFQTQIDEATAVDYTITGTWENPHVERITTAANQSGPLADPSTTP